MSGRGDPKTQNLTENGILKVENLGKKKTFPAGSQPTSVTNSAKKIDFKKREIELQVEGHSRMLKQR